VISLYAKGMTTGDIKAHLAEIYGTDISRDRISRITDAVVEDMVAWQNRPLHRVGRAWELAPTARRGGRRALRHGGTSGAPASPRGASYGLWLTLTGRSRPHSAPPRGLRRATVVVPTAWAVRGWEPGRRSSPLAGHASRTPRTTPNLVFLAAAGLGTASGSRPGKGAAQRPLVAEARGEPRCLRSSSN
jgi:Transposase, Mutator family